VHSKSEFRVKIVVFESQREDVGLNQWVWIDLRYYSLGAWLGDVGPLNLAEFQMFINQEQRRKKLKLLIYNMEKRTEKLTPLDRCPKQEFNCFTGWNEKIGYWKVKNGKHQKI
jgi:hypothetical protein